MRDLLEQKLARFEQLEKEYQARLEREREAEGAAGAPLPTPPKN